MSRIYLILILIFHLIFLSPLRAQEKTVLTLENAVQSALENNPDIVISDADIDISKASIRNAKSVYYPQVRARLIVPFIGRESGFYLDQLIYDFGRTTNRVKASEAELDSAVYNKQTTSEDLIMNTTINYYNVLAQKHIVEAKTKKIIEYEKRLELAQEFLKAGRTALLEVTKSEVNLGNVKLELLSAENNLEIAKVNLMTAMGIEGKFIFELEDSLEYSSQIMNLDEAINKALNARPEIKSVYAREDFMKANLEISKKEFYPTIFGRTAYRFEGEGAQTPGFIVGLGVRFPIFEGFSRFAQVDSARANLKRSKAVVESLKTKITSEIKQLYLDLKYSEQNIAVTENTINSVEQSLNLARERYNLNRASEVELAEAKSLYASTNAKYMHSIYNYKIIFIQFKRAIGEINESEEQ